MASGLPVIGLDAEGTRDLVTDDKTGYLVPQPPCDWSTACQRSSPHFRQLATHYAQLLTKACGSHGEREEMGTKASTEGIKGYTWWDAMEVCFLPVYSYTGLLTCSDVWMGIESPWVYLVPGAWNFKPKEPRILSQYRPRQRSPESIGSCRSDYSPRPRRRLGKGSGI
jgi:hypothetical protein